MGLSTLRSDLRSAIEQGQPISPADYDAEDSIIESELKSLASDLLDEGQDFKAQIALQEARRNFQR